MYIQLNGRPFRERRIGIWAISRDSNVGSLSTVVSSAPQGPLVSAWHAPDRGWWRPGPILRGSWHASPATTRASSSRAPARTWATPPQARPARPPQRPARTSSTIGAAAGKRQPDEREAGPGCSCGGAVWCGRGELMPKFWRRKVQTGPPHAVPDAQPVAVPADLLAWAREVDVSRLSDKTVRNAEDYLKKYRHMNLELSQQLGWQLIAAVEAQVTPCPPADAQPLDVLATVVALRRKQLGIGLSSPSALACPPLGYEPYDVRLQRLAQSLADAVTLADRQTTACYISYASSVGPKLGGHNLRSDLFFRE